VAEGAWRLGLVADDEGLRVLVHGEEVARYRYGADLWKPYLFPLRLPGGPCLLDDGPADHPHHHGLWFGHGRVDADGAVHDVWLERPGAGRIVHRGLELLPDGWVAAAEWQAADGAPLARDRRTFRLAVSADRLVVRVEYALWAAEGRTVRLRGTNEAGLPLVRPAPWLAARGGGRVVAPDGRAGEAELFGRPAPWVDAQGVRDGVAWGLAFVDEDPETLWFVRDYGPLGPNPAYFRGEATSLPLRRRCALVAHRGPWTP
jgi:hypothetical protein